MVSLTGRRGTQITVSDQRDYNVVPCHSLIVSAVLSFIEICPLLEVLETIGKVILGARAMSLIKFVERFLYAVPLSESPLLEIPM